MTRTKTTIALAAAVLMLAAPLAMAQATLGGEKTTMQKGGSKSGSTMTKKDARTNKPGAATTLGGKTKGAN